MSSEETSSRADGASFSLDVGDDLLAEALAAVERREDQARARRRPADPNEMEAFAADLELDDTPPEVGEDDDSGGSVAIELEFDDSFDPDSEDEGPGGAAPSPLGGPASTNTDENALYEGILEDGSSAAHDPAEGELEAPTEAELGLGEGAQAALLRELTRLQARVAEVGQEREEALDRAARFEERLLQHDAAQHELTTELEETRLRLRKYRAARKRQLEEARRSEAALSRARERASRAEDRAATAESARDEAARSLREALSRLTEAERAIEHAHQRRRRELADQKRSVAERCWKTVLPVLDNLQLALSHAGGEAALVVQGVGMVERQFLGVLASAGVTPVEASRGQPFDPTVHEAVERTETEDVAPDAIVALMQAGYQLGGRLLRPARVSVAAPISTGHAAAPTGDADAAEAAGPVPEPTNTDLTSGDSTPARDTPASDTAASDASASQASDVPEADPADAPTTVLSPVPAPDAPVAPVPEEPASADQPGPSSHGEPPSHPEPASPPEPASEQPPAAPALEPAPSAPDAASTTAPSD